MKKEKLQNKIGGFVPILIIAIVAILAVGGGVYLSKQNKVGGKGDVAEKESDAVAQGIREGEPNPNTNQGETGTLRALMKIGKNTMCTFTSDAGNSQSSGTVYITTDGKMRGDFESQTSAGTIISNMIVKDGYSYVWSNGKGMKMNLTNAQTTTNTQTEQNVNLDAKVDYKCSDWNLDSSKFNLPSGVEFIDLEVLMKATLPTGLPSGVSIPKGY